MANGYNKIYIRNYWENNTPPAMNDVNLNNLENGVNTLDDRVVTLDKTKLDQSTANTMVKDVTFNESTGIFTVTKLNGSTFTIDTKLEKIAVNFRFDKENQVLVIVLDDGTEQQVDLSALITQYEFLDSDTVVFTISADGKVSANIKNGSITDEMLEPNYLANITVQAGKAQASENAAAQSASDADYDAKLAQSYAIGESGIRDGENTDNAKYYKEQAQNSSDSASNSASSALLSSQTATTKASEAATSSANAKTSESNAKSSETAAKTSETNAKSSEVSSLNSANKAAQSETNSERNANLSESYAVGTDGTIRPNDNVDCAKYYYEQARQISEGLSGGLLPMGTITFSQLASQTKVKGYMYNISDEFVTDETFKEGAGLTFPAGSNVYWTTDGYWDVLAGSPVTGVKGDKETTFRRGNVNITSDDIGALAVDGDSKSNTVTFTSNDVSDGNATSWTSVTALTSGITHATFFQRVSQMFKNVRYLYKMLGTTDISSIGDGTTTGAISTIKNDLQTQITEINNNLTPKTTFIGDMFYDDIFTGASNDLVVIKKMGKKVLLNIHGLFIENPTHLYNIVIGKIPENMIPDYLYEGYAYFTTNDTPGRIFVSGTDVTVYFYNEVSGYLFASVEWFTY